MKGKSQMSEKIHSDMKPMVIPMPVHQLNQAALEHAQCGTQARRLAAQIAARCAVHEISLLPSACGRGKNDQNCDSAHPLLVPVSLLGLHQDREPL